MAKRRLIFIALFAVMAPIMTSCKAVHDSQSTSTPKVLYHCAMHPKIVSDKPGECPICHMKLTVVGGYAEKTAPTAPIDGQSSVHLTSELEQRIGVRVDAVKQRELTVSVRAPARVAYDQSLAGVTVVYADVSDTQVGFLHSGQSVDLTSPATSGNVYKGTVRSIDSVVNNDTRMIRVRILIAQASADLRPGIYLTAVIQASSGRALSVPESAVIDTGTRQIAYVQTQPGLYEPREVHVGPEADGYSAVLSGLRSGELVAVSANFLIDSESRIEAAAQEAQR